jgi:glycosyltransferase involved in cell wall biosynthesis
MHHGGSLRFFNLARELIALGHEVYFTSNRRPQDDPLAKEQFLATLRQDGAISGHLETAYQLPRWSGRMARLAVHPGLVNRALRRLQEPTRREVKQFVAAHRIDACVFGDRPMLFLMPELARSMPAIIDWTDSYVLFWTRQIKVHVEHGHVAGLPYAVRRLSDAFVNERYYGRRSHLNLAVSPVDKHWLDIITGRPERNRVLLNGVRLAAAAPPAARLEDRLVFSGNMSFPPNYEGAIWFIDHVLPLLHERDHSIRFYVAGANPVPQLEQRRTRPGVEIAGFVPNLQDEIARSRVYVAPLISGGGFKNKILEAIAAGQFVIATTRAVEFLDPEIRRLLLLGDTPEALARHVLDYLANPGAFAERIAALQQIVHTQFTWKRRAAELLDMVQSALAEVSGAGIASKSDRPDAR